MRRKDIELWAEISATDDSGVTVQGIKTGDVIEIQSVSGICSFSEQTGAAKVLSVIGFAGEVVASAAVGGKVGTAANIVKGQAGSIKTQMENSGVKSAASDEMDTAGMSVGTTNSPPRTAASSCACRLRTDHSMPGKTCTWRMAQSRMAA